MILISSSFYFFTTIQSNNKNHFFSDAFDVYIDRRRRVRLLDFAPFRGTDSLLFEWDELAADTKQTDELIRVIEKASHIVPSPVAHYRLPRDLVNVSTANAIDEFSRESRDNNSNEAAKQP